MSNKQNYVKKNQFIKKDSFSQVNDQQSENYYNQGNQNYSQQQVYQSQESQQYQKNNPHYIKKNSTSHYQQKPQSNFGGGGGFQNQHHFPNQQQKSYNQDQNTYSQNQYEKDPEWEIESGLGDIDFDEEKIIGKKLDKVAILKQLEQKTQIIPRSQTDDSGWVQELEKEQEVQELEEDFPSLNSKDQHIQNKPNNSNPFQQGGNKGFQGHQNQSQYTNQQGFKGNGFYQPQQNKQAQQKNYNNQQYPGQNQRNYLQQNGQFDPVAYQQQFQPKQQINFNQLQPQNYPQQFMGGQTGQGYRRQPQNNYFPQAQQMMYMNPSPQFFPQQFYPPQTLLSLQKILTPFQFYCIDQDCEKNEPLWYYIDMSKNQQGPISSEIMDQWYNAQFFHDTLPIAFKETKKFLPLKEMLVEYLKDNQKQETQNLPEQNLDNNEKDLDKIDFLEQLKNFGISSKDFKIQTDSTPNIGPSN